MTTAVSRGAVPVRLAVEAHLQSLMPTLIDQAIAPWGLTARQLPHPLRYDAWDPWEIQEYPLVGAYVQRARNFTRMNNAATGSPYRPLYSVQVAVWAEDTRFDGTLFQDPTPQGATRVANDLMAILRAALLEYPNLGRPEVFTFEEDTYNEEFIPASKPMSGDSWIAAGVSSFQVHVNEQNLLDGTVLGTAETVTLTVTGVGPAQEFPEVP